MKTPSLLNSALVAVACLAGAPAFAEAGSMSPEKQQWCQENPQKCEEKKARRKAWCQENPEACAKARARREEMRKQCAADPVACEQRKEERRKRREEFRKQCEADPVACEKKKEERRQRWQERHGQTDPAPVQE